MGRRPVTPEHQRLLDRMPQHATVDVDGFGPVFCCHATPRDDEEVVLVDSRAERWAEVYQDLPAAVETVLCGHTHLPFTRLVDHRLVLNPGSVGLPYGRPGAHWAVLEGGAVTLGRTAVDPDELIRTVAAASQLPDVEAWLEDVVRRPASEVEAMAAFGPRDGR